MNPNHNVALRQISAASKYCKMVFADDWIFPECIEEMVAVAEQQPSVGVVGAYGLQEHEVCWAGLPYPSTLVKGRDICRRMFLDDLYVFGTSTSVLYRSDLVRSRPAFYNEANFHADREACVVLLKTCDFGFVHQILTFKRLQPGSLTPAVSYDLRTHFGCMLLTLVTHGHEFLTDQEFQACLERLLTEYHNFLAVSFMRGRLDMKFWEYQKKKLNETVGFSRARLAKAIGARLCRMLLNPYETIEKLRQGRRPAVAKTPSAAIDRSGLRPHAGESR